MKHNKGPEPDQAQDIKRLSPVTSKDAPKQQILKAAELSKGPLVICFYITVGVQTGL